MRFSSPRARRRTATAFTIALTTYDPQSTDPNQDSNFLAKFFDTVKAGGSTVEFVLTTELLSGIADGKTPEKLRLAA